MDSIADVCDDVLDDAYLSDILQGSVPYSCTEEQGILQVDPPVSDNCQ